MQRIYATKAQRYLTYLIDMLLIVTISSLLVTIVERMIGFDYNEIQPLMQALSNEFTLIVTTNRGSLERVQSLMVQVFYYYFIDLGITLAVGLVLVVGYLVVLPMFWSKQTLGRFVMRTKVVNKGEMEVSKGRIVLRELLGTFVFYMFLGAIPIIISIILVIVKKRSLVDIISKTDLIYDMPSIQKQNEFSSDDNVIDAKITDVDSKDNDKDETSNDEYKVV